MQPSVCYKDGGRGMDSDRRRAPRYRLIADAEITESISDTKLHARTSDLSIGGCFLDMLNPSPRAQKFGSGSLTRAPHSPQLGGWHLLSPTWESALLSQTLKVIKSWSYKNGSRVGACQIKER